MRVFRSLRGTSLVLLASVAAFGPLSGAIAQTPVGSEFRVNTVTAGNQSAPAVASDADGDFVVAWQSSGQDGDGQGVFAQRYDATGTAAGFEFRVNTTIASDQFDPAVASDAAGNFVVVWTSSGQDGAGFGIFAQRYDATGSPGGSEFRVNTTTTGDQLQPSVASDADGDFVVSWSSAGQDGSGFGVFAQRYDAGGVPAGPEFRVNTFTAGSQLVPAVAADADGDFVVAWESIGQDGDSSGIFAQRYDATGVPAGAEFRVNTTTAGGQLVPAVAAAADGDFVVAWESAGQDGAGFGIFAQRYDAGGVPAGPEFRVNTFTAGDQRLPAVASDADGDLVVAWQSTGQDGAGFGIFAQRYGAGGVPAGPEFRVNTFTAGDQTVPAVASDADGEFVVVWESAGQDGSGEGIFAQRFAPAPSSDLSVTKTAPNRAHSNKPFTYTITVTNSGPDAATGVELTDQLGEEDVTFVSAAPPCTHNSGVVTCSLGTLDAGQSIAVTITVTVDPGTDTVTNTAQVTSNVTDPDPVDNTAILTTKVVGPKKPKP